MELIAKLAGGIANRGGPRRPMQPQHPMRRPDASKSELDAPDHHVVDHLAGGPAASVALQ